MYSNYNVNDKETFNLDRLDKLSSKFPNVEIEDINIDERKYANIEIIDYKGFVKLVADNEKTQNWL